MKKVILLLMGNLRMVINGITKRENNEGELIEKEFKKGKLTNGHIITDYIPYRFDFKEIDSSSFHGEYKKGKRWKGKGKELS